MTKYWLAKSILPHQFSILLNHQKISLVYRIMGICIQNKHHFSPELKGRDGEKRVNRWIKSHLDSEQYTLIENLTLPTEDGTTQIDHVVVSQFGIFVIETKNMKGWIFGGASQKKWTQSLFTKRIQFQNPLHQNFKHIKAISSLIGEPADQIFSIVVFVGDSEFKTKLPENVFHGDEFLSFIKSKVVKIYHDIQIRSYLNKIETERFEDSYETDIAHITHLKQLHSDVVPLIYDDGRKFGGYTIEKNTGGANGTIWVIALIIGLIVLPIFLVDNKDKEPLRKSTTIQSSAKAPEKPIYKGLVKPKLKAPIASETKTQLPKSIEEKPRLIERHQNTIAKPDPETELLKAKRACNAAALDEILDTNYDDDISKKRKKLCSEYERLKAQY